MMWSVRSGFWDGFDVGWPMFDDQRIECPMWDAGCWMIGGLMCDMEFGLMLDVSYGSWNGFDVGCPMLDDRH